MSLKSTIQKNLILVPGWKTRRKIVVIESDDWGSIRMPDKQTFDLLAADNPALHKDAMCRYDSLESNDDMQAMFDVLSAVKDSSGNHAILTANTITGNPDFDRIAASGFMEYAWEKFTDTLQRYPNHDKVTALIAQGIARGLYQPQFHGREHVNVQQWLLALQQGHTALMQAFRHRVFGIAITGNRTKRNNLMSALDYEDAKDADAKKSIVAEGMDAFETLFGFRSASFIATTYIWDSAIEKTLYDGGVNFIQGIPYQYIPNPGGAWYKRKFHYTGQKNKIGQTYLVRNAYFEPSLAAGKDVTNECLHRIKLAFSWGKPAIIGSHRVNFIGAVEEQNRTANLKQFHRLLKKIVATWPDVEFMSSDQLGKAITGK